MTDQQLEELTLITQPVEDRLNQRQLFDYRNHRKELCLWLLNLGKDPSTGEGYAQTTVKNRIYRMDQFYRWVWDEKDGYTTDVTKDQADEYVKEIAYSEHSNGHKNNVLKALKMLFKWRHHELGEHKWEPDMTFKTESKQPRDYFTIEERKRLREAALEYGSIPGYNDLSPEERDRWKAHLAQRFEKPKSEVSPSDWKKANGWKIPSMVWVSLDAGLRPIEVERAVTGWVDTDNSVLRIPKEESSKNREHWVVGLRDRTAINRPVFAGGMTHSSTARSPPPVAVGPRFDNP